jgi:predicted AAA+ superfamily ATPase
MKFSTQGSNFHGYGSELARAFGVSDAPVRGYLDTLTATFVIRQLRPWSENIGKRQVRSPKVFIADSGVLHTLLGIPDQTKVRATACADVEREIAPLSRKVARRPIERRKRD